MAGTTVDPETFKATLSNSPSAVTVLTVSGTDGTDPHGITVSSFASGSLEPPLVVVGIDRESETHERLVGDETGFCVNLLAANQRDLAEHFADMTDLGDPFRRSHRTSRSGAPVFDDAVGFLDCEHFEAVELGDHVLHVGRVVDAAVLDASAPPLTYCRGEWGTVTDDPPTWRRVGS
ncbi:flavin reductase family protein [Haloarchaeobius litoreus]|uniref:Flavin reductase family protein n=1 Tax=Haloarchaeobius litoreus TaxID=755306 RepID=A0ABD6DPV0_9EURY|nr:flavin reductase family protein [Haloarchaeobius litoreus]